MTQRGSTTYSYNGDGALVYDGTTRYTQDLAAPLTQILQTTQSGATTDYLYGRERLAAQSSSAKTWYLGDALGSVRATLDDNGAPLENPNYDPWGTPESGTVPTFGFTGELQDAGAGLVNLRARWYSTGNGTFTARDTFAGILEQPQTLALYLYAENNPTNRVDPSGHCSEVTAQDRTDLCWMTYYKVWDKLSEGDAIFWSAPPEGLSAWDTPALQNLLGWLEAGIRFTNNSSSPDDIWTANNFSTVVEALKRVQVALGSKMQSGLGLSTGTLIFNKIHAGYGGDGAIGGLANAPIDGNDIRGHIDLDLRQDTHELSSPEVVIEIAIHEMGHIVDANAGFDDGSWWSTCVEWQNAIKDADGAISNYALNNGAMEDFAETFTWFVEDQNGRKYQFPHFGKNPGNIIKYGGDPDPTRLTALQSALARLP